MELHRLLYRGDVDDPASIIACADAFSKLDAHMKREIQLQVLKFKAAALYANPTLYYHNWHHIQKMYTDYSRVFGEPSPEVALAIAYHDCVYVPGLRPGLYGTNETLSAATFRHMYTHEFGAYEEPEGEMTVIDVDFVQELILATDLRNHVAPDYRPRGVPEQQLLDADLSSFAGSYLEFMRHQDNVLLEALGPVQLSTEQGLRAARSKQAQFLDNFIAESRDYVYHTLPAREAWEDSARQNIMRFCDEWTI